jgi:hypothetical protein
MEIRPESSSAVTVSFKVYLKCVVSSITGEIMILIDWSVITVL